MATEREQFRATIIRKDGTTAVVDYSDMLAGEPGFPGFIGFSDQDQDTRLFSLDTVSEMIIEDLPKEEW